MEKRALFAEFKKVLEKVPLTKAEREVYFACVKAGEIPLAKLAASMKKLQRQTVYTIVDSLVARGLLVSNDAKYKKVVYPASISRLEAMVGVEQRKLRRLELSLKEIKPMLEAVMPHHGKPRFEHYDTVDGFITLMNKSLHENEKKKLRFFGNYAAYRKIVSDAYEFEYFIPMRVKLGIHVQALIKRRALKSEQIANSAEELRELRYIREDAAVSSTFMTFDDTSVFLSDEKDVVAVSVTSPSITRMMNQFFEHFWEEAQ
jgi:sugar-specific transcriptional regulator TrmB